MSASLSGISRSLILTRVTEASVKTHRCHDEQRHVYTNKTQPSPRRLRSSRVGIFATRLGDWVMPMRTDNPRHPVYALTTYELRHYRRALEHSLKGISADAPVRERLRTR